MFITFALAESFVQYDEALIVSTNLHTRSFSTDALFICILNDNGFALRPSTTALFRIDILAAGGNKSGKLDFPLVTWPDESYLILTNDYSAFQTNFSAFFRQSAEPPKPWRFDEVGYLQLYVGDELVQTLDLTLFPSLSNDAFYVYEDVWSIYKSHFYAQK